MNKPRLTFYIDSEGISDALGQIQDGVTISKTSKTRRGISNTKASEFGLGAAFACLLNTAKASLKFERNTSNDEAQESLTQIGIESHLQTLMSTLRRSRRNMFFEDLDDTYMNLGKEDSAWVLINERWDVPAFPSGLEAINAEQRFLFTIGKREGDYHYEDQYFSKTQRDFNVEMAASFERCPRLKGRKLGASSHEALILNKYGGKNIPLKVFGYLLKVEHKLQIVPYAIWF